MAITVNKSRKIQMITSSLQSVKAATTVYQGAFVSTDPGNHTAGGITNLAAGSSDFIGIAIEEGINTTGALNDCRIIVATSGVLDEVAVTGATGHQNVGTIVYASDNDTLTLTSTSASRFGKIESFNPTTSLFSVAFWSVGQGGGAT